MMESARVTPPVKHFTLRDRHRLGWCVASIANPLTLISPETIRTHLSNVFSKLQVADRVQAIIRARKAGLG
jgi:DNA-binding NarL/FixJ family response regulator